MLQISVDCVMWSKLTMNMCECTDCDNDNDANCLLRVNVLLKTVSVLLNIMVFYTQIFHIVNSWRLL